MPTAFTLTAAAVPPQCSAIGGPNLVGCLRAKWGIDIDIEVLFNHFGLVQQFELFIKQQQFKQLVQQQFEFKQLIQQQFEQHPGFDNIKFIQ